MKPLLCMMVAAFSILQASAADWMRGDLEKAQAKAKAENKLLLIYFTGSDW